MQLPGEEALPTVTAEASACAMGALRPSVYYNSLPFSLRPNSGLRSQCSTPHRPAFPSIARPGSVKGCHSESDGHWVSVRESSEGGRGI